MKRLTRRSREKHTISSSELPRTDHPPRMRKRSTSEIIISPPRSHGDQPLHYLGFSSITDPRFTREIQSVIRNVCASNITHKIVTLSYHDGLLRISESSGDNLLVCPLHFVSQVTHDVSREHKDCLAISFGMGRYAYQCHVLQARTSREAADIVQVLQKAYRSASKGMKSRKTSDSSFPTPMSSPGFEFQQVKGRVHTMEDEDELIEHKSLSQFTKRGVAAQSHMSSGETTFNRMSTTSSDSTPSLHTRHTLTPAPITPSPKDKRKVSRKSGGHHLSSDGEFTLSERAHMLSTAVDNILANNKKLRDKCCTVQPSNPFEDALYAMQSSEFDLLERYIIHDVVTPNEADVQGNTLLHYAVALGRMELVLLLCNRMASLDAPGWNECRPIHRATAEGNIPVLQVLLVRGASVNGVDLMRRTPLHLSSSKRELMECSIALLEYGAQITATDVIGVRPHDLSPELKETQNRLVTSACESFVSSQFKDPGPLLPAGSSSATPSSLSPVSTRPSSIASARSADLWTSADTPTDTSLDELLLEVHSRANVITLQSKAQAKKTKFKKSMNQTFSRSFGNLTELQESEEDDMYRRARLEQLKFPSEYGINSSYALEANAGLVITRLNELIREGKKHKRRGVVYNQWLTEEERKTSMLSSSGEDGMRSSVPNLHDSSVSSMRSDELPSPGGPPRPFSSAAVLQGNRVHSPLVQHRLRADSLVSHSSTGTLVRDDSSSEVSSSIRQVSKAFDNLERDLCGNLMKSKSQDSLDAVVVTLPETLKDKLKSHHQLEIDSSPLMEKRSREETEAIFDAIIGQLTGDVEGLQQGLDTMNDNQPINETQQNGNESHDGELKSHDQVEMHTTTKEVKRADSPSVRQGQSSDNDDKKKKSGKRSKSKSKDTSYSTLPNKKGKGRWPGMRRIGSPLFRTRQKSFSSKDDGNPLPPRHHEKKLKRKMSLPEVNLLSTMESQPITRASSSDHMPQSMSSSATSFDALFNGQPSGQQQSDPVANALKLMVTLSTNRECLSTLISYICLPKCVTRLTQLSQNLHTPRDVINNIATLIQNLFEAGGRDGRKSALGSGLLDLTVKLLHSRDPIPGTCLSLLNSLLVSEDDNDYLRTIIRIPTKPLLLYLEPHDLSGESDSGYDRRNTSVSMTTRSSSDAQELFGLDEGLGGSSLTVPRVGAGQLGVKFRATSFTSETSESSSGRSLYSPTLGGQTVTYLEARRIVLKMLAVLSSHSKMQIELAKEGTLKLLVAACKDNSLENVTNSLITLANVARNIGSHGLLLQLGTVEQLLFYQNKGPRARYHATRALVYLGKLDKLNKISLFEPMATGYETDVVILTKDEDGHSYARGATIEKCVEILTGDIQQLWGGFNLSMGVHSHSNNDQLAPKATKDQILDFFLTTYQSFVQPIILMRLLLHRLATTGNQNPFDWSLAPEKAVVMTTTHTTSIPPAQTSVLKLIGQWIESYPDDFIEHPALQQEVLKIVQRLKLARGPYLPHAHRLKSFLQDINHPRMNSSLASADEERRVPHHDNLYKLCKQMVLGGYLPVTMDTAMYLASLQLHIENIAPPISSGPETSPTHSKKRSFTGLLKLALPVGTTKSKHLVKRVRNQMIDFDSLSERNSKHLYIERCQSNPGYDCTFFSVRVPSGGILRRGPPSKQLLGISTKRVVFLEEKTKELLASHSLQSVLSINRESDPCSLVMSFKGDVHGCKMQVDSLNVAREITNVLDQCKGEGMNEDTSLRWSESIPSLFTVSVEQGELADSAGSTPSTSSPEREITSPTAGISHDFLASETTPTHLNGSLRGHTHKLDTLRAVVHGDSLDIDVPDNNVVFQGEERMLFCDCPPDPELPPSLNLNHLQLTQVLGCTLEVARQITIIAHDHFCGLTSVELLQKVNVIPKSSKTQRDSTRSSVSLSDIEQQETNIEKLAYRFNQVGNWVASSILQYDVLDERIEVVQQFITIAKHCMELHNYSSMMAIIVAGLGSAPIRRLHQTWAGVSKTKRELFKQMDTILDSRGNYKHYRQKLSVTVTPAVPYVGVFLKDLTFICDGNPDYLRGGLINVHKRRQVYKKLEEIRHFQHESYKLHKVPELRQYLLSHRPVAEDDLHSLSHTVEPRITRSLSASQNLFRKITSSSSSSNLHKTG